MNVESLKLKVQSECRRQISLQTVLALYLYKVKRIAAPTLSRLRRNIPPPSLGESDESIGRVGSGRITFSLLLLFLFAAQLSAQNYAGPSDAFKKKALEEIAKDNRKNFHFVAAKLRAGRDTELAWKQLDSLLAEPTGDMFWTYPATAFYFYCNDLLSDKTKQKFRHVWKTWTPYRGDTENHFLMYYETLYLLSQEWPDLPGSEWFNGKSSEENFREAEEYLNHWIDETVRYGQTEWDSPRYLYFYITPLLTLYDFTKDPTMKKRCGMILEYLLADYAAEYLNGNYCGAHSRDGDGSVINPRTAEATSYAQFFWEDSLDFILPDLAFAAMSSFRCPQIIRDIAHDRDTPFTHFERKRSRAKMRYSDERYTGLQDNLHDEGLRAWLDTRRFATAYSATHVGRHYQLAQTEQHDFCSTPLCLRT